MRLLKLNLRNFKGQKDFSFQPNGRNAAIYGDNAVGKTTIFDAFLWLLFGKDSQNRKDFDIKTLDSNGNAIHGLEHTVEGIFEIDGEQLTLRKVYSEKWTKRKGAAMAEFTGHTIDHFVDGVPVKQSEYETKIAEIAREDLFKLLTTPSYFNEQLKWPERRKILLEVCGDVTDADVIASNTDLKELPGILGKRSAEEHKKVIAARKVEVNKELDKLPVRIDEATKGLPDISGLDGAALDREITRVKEEKQAKEAELSRVKNGAEVTEKERQLMVIDTDLLRIKSEHEALLRIERNQQQIKLDDLNREIRAIDKQVYDEEDLIRLQRKIIERSRKEMTDLRQQWLTVNARTFAFEQSNTCPTCGQDLPTDRLKQARSDALASFNASKAQEMEKINIAGRERKDGIAEKEEFVAELEEEIRKLNDQLGQMKDQAGHIQREIERLNENLQNADQTEQYQAKLTQKQAILAEIEQLKSDIQPSVDALQAEIDLLEEKLWTLSIDKDQIRRYEQGQARIKELSVMERELAAEYERLEHELYLIEEFTRTKVAMLTDRINGKFQTVRFILFEEQINGGLADTCQTMLGGVPYASLNLAGQIRAGLEILNTLARHYDFFPPVFLDQAESITNIPVIESQLITLHVSKGDKQLRVELERPELVLFKEGA